MMCTAETRDATRRARNRRTRRAEKEFPVMKMSRGYTGVYLDALARRGRPIGPAPIDPATSE